ncbi:MAG TPA: hypothetical protein VGS19_36120 [Streptosporangiaceae bacterium]|nr:hypothetical protein [Streptosporangiaceae bacterium]
MKIRIMGLPSEVDQAVNALRSLDMLDLVEVSDPYPNRGHSRMARVYIEARLTYWCARLSHDGDCCEGSRRQWAADSQAGQPSAGQKKQLR